MKQRRNQQLFHQCLLVVSMAISCRDQLPQTPKAPNKDTHPNHISQHNLQTNKTRPHKTHIRLEGKAQTSTRELKLNFRSYHLLPNRIALSSIEPLPDKRFIGVGLRLDTNISGHRGLLRGQPILGAMNSDKTWKTVRTFDSEGECFRVNGLRSTTNRYVAYCERRPFDTTNKNLSEVLVHRLSSNFSSAHIQRIGFDSRYMTVFGFSLAGHSEILAAGYQLPGAAPNWSKHTPKGFVAKLDSTAPSSSIHWMQDYINCRSAHRLPTGEHLLSVDTRDPLNDCRYGELLLADSRFHSARNAHNIVTNISHIHWVSGYSNRDYFYSGQLNGGQAFGKPITDGYAFIAKTDPDPEKNWIYQTDLINSQFTDIHLTTNNLLYALLFVDNTAANSRNKNRRWKLRAPYGYRLVILNIRTGDELLNKPVIGTEHPTRRSGRFTIQPGNDVHIHCVASGRVSVVNDEKYKWINIGNTLRSVWTIWRSGELR